MVAAPGGVLIKSSRFIFHRNLPIISKLGTTVFLTLITITLDDLKIIMEPQKLKEVLTRLECAKRIVAFTGAGISQESGIATFRGNGGIWGKYRVEEVATPEAFFANPKLVWDFYLERRRGALEAKPNSAHQVIAAWEKKFPFVGVVTQNIDGLHEKAGSTKIQELHGNIWQARCSDCGATERDESLERTELPLCKHCKGLVRPHIVWFGEALDFDIIQEALKWMRQADIIFVVGTSGVVEPAASFVREAKSEGVFIVEVNIENTALTHIADVSLFGKSGEIFAELNRY